MTPNLVRPFPRLILTAVLALSSLIIGCSHSAPRVAHGDQAVQVETFFRSGIEAFNRHDLETFLQQFGDDIQMYTPTGWLRGKSAVRERFATTFAQFPAVRMELEELTARQVAPGTVATDFRWRVYPMGKGPAFHGVGSGVYVRNGTAWVEVMEHETVTRVDAGLPGAGR